MDQSAWGVTRGRHRLGLIPVEERLGPRNVPGPSHPARQALGPYAFVTREALEQGHRRKLVKFCWLVIAAVAAAPSVAAQGENDFESPLLAPGDTFPLRFDRPGAVAYDCEIHPFMTGTIKVGPRTGNGREHDVGITDGDTWGFAPGDLSIAVGDTVIWQNTGAESHRVGGSMPPTSKESPLPGLLTLLVVFAPLAWLRR